MKVVMLCGGIGRRMYPLAEDKFLLKFLGKTLLEHQMGLAIQAGIRDFVIVCNPQSRQKTEAAAKTVHGAEVSIVVQPRPLGMADAIENARQFVTEEFVLLNPNDLFEVSAYDAILGARRSARATAFITGSRVTSYFPGGYLKTDGQGNLQHVVEKPGPGHEPSDMVNLVLHLHTEPDVLLDYIARTETDRDDRYERALDAMCHDGKVVRVVPYSGAWQPIKYPWHILDATRFFLDRTATSIAPSARISDRAVIDGKVVISENVRVLENAVVRGPVYIGPGAVIGNSTLVREYSHVGARCVVGFGTEVKGSYIGDGTQLHMSYAGDSVIGEDCNLAAGTITANWRFDEQTVKVKVGQEAMDTGKTKFGVIMGHDTRTGINVSIMPGVKVPPHSLIQPGTTLKRDIA
jgi:bifunctional UDP-N-acetylglucosamine pyrophosphorylase/glucosamine-1-phosphate N-acetyltransferase